MVDHTLCRGNSKCESRKFDPEPQVNAFKPKKEINISLSSVIPHSWTHAVWDIISFMIMNQTAFSKLNLQEKTQFIFTLSCFQKLFQMWVLASVSNESFNDSVYRSLKALYMKYRSLSGTSMHKVHQKSYANSIWSNNGHGIMLYCKLLNIRLILQSLTSSW